MQETEAPEGYDKDLKEYPITKEDLEASRASGSTITLKIKNKKTEVKKKSTSFSVEKRWVLDPKLATNKPDNVTVSVLKNGVKDDNLTVVLSQENGKHPSPIFRRKVLTERKSYTPFPKRN